MPESPESAVTDRDAPAAAPTQADPVVALRDQIDDDTLAALQDRVGDALSAGHRRIVLELSAVTAIALPTVSRFCRALRQWTRDDAELALVNGPPHLRRTVQLCAIGGVRLHGSVEEALSEHDGT